jgi:hypothetical protein
MSGQGSSERTRIVATDTKSASVTVNTEAVVAALPQFMADAGWNITSRHISGGHVTHFDCGRASISVIIDGNSFLYEIAQAVISPYGLRALLLSGDTDETKDPGSADDERWAFVLLKVSEDSFMAVQRVVLTHMFDEVNQDEALWLLMAP